MSFVSIRLQGSKNIAVHATCPWRKLRSWYPSLLLFDRTRSCLQMRIVASRNRSTLHNRSTSLLQSDNNYSKRHSVNYETRLFQIIWNYFHLVSSIRKRENWIELNITNLQYGSLLKNLTNPLMCSHSKFHHHRHSLRYQCNPWSPTRR